MRLRTMCCVLLLAGFAVLAQEPVKPAEPPKPVQVPGTFVEMNQPAGFEKATSFTGFMNRALNASIMVTVLPEPYSKTIANYTKEKLEARNETLFNAGPATFGAAPGQLLVATMKANNASYAKIYGIFGENGQSVVVTVTVAEASAKEPGVWDTLIGTVRSARISPDVFLGKPYAVKFAAPIAFPRRLDDGVMATNVEKPIDLTKLLYFFIAKRVNPVKVEDPEAFGRELLEKMPQVKGVQVTGVKKVQLNGLPGCELTGVASYSTTGKPCLVYLTILPAELTRYFILQGIAPVEREPGSGIEGDDAAIFKTFSTLAGTFRRKSS
ncbi:MAG: hypothetical protein BWY76_00504 [bacterium ADurb.Bin429]|nr:MAG: hypothetical protein BWY76_00504 [bacterium ADurb.Bin429]